MNQFALNYATNLMHPEPSYLASEIFDDPELAAGVDKSWLRAQTKDYFSGMYVDQARVIGAAKVIVDFLVGRAWIMSEIGEDTFAFTHQTFLEYFFARHLDGSYDTVGELMKFLLPRILRSEWDVVSHLALQLKTHKSVRKQDEALDWLNKKVNFYKTKKRDEAIRSFTAKAFEYLSGTEDRLGTVIESLNFSKVEPEQLRIEDIDRLSLAERSARIRKEFVRDRVTDRFAGLITSGRRDVGPLQKECGRLFEASPLGRSFVPVHLANIVREKARETICSTSASHRTFNPLRLQWYGVYEKGSVSDLGLSAYVQGFFPNELDGLSWAALSTATSGRFHVRPNEVAPTSAVGLLEDLVSLDPERIFAGFKWDSDDMFYLPTTIWRTIYEDAKNNFASLQALLLIREITKPVTRDKRSIFRIDSSKSIKWVSKVEKDILDNSSDGFRKRYQLVKDEKAKVMVTPSPSEAPQ